MDPLSIAASATALATLAYSLVKTSQTCIELTKNVDSDITFLHSEILALSQSLEALSALLTSSTFQHSFKTSTSGFSTHLKPLATLEVVLFDCKKALEKLNVLLAKIEANSGLSFEPLRKPILALRLNAVNPTLKLLRSQIQSHWAAIQFCLQLVSV
jgi:hypothetical protein